MPRDRSKGRRFKRPSKRSENDLALPDSFGRYLESECGLAANTVAAYTRDVRQFLSWLAQRGGATMADIARLQLQDFIDWLEHQHRRDLATGSIARALVSVKIFFRYLVLEGRVADSVAEEVNSPALWNRLPKVLSPERVEALLTAPNKKDDRYPLRDRALLCTLYATGCRITEAANLRIEDLDFHQNSCRVIGKGNKERVVSLNPIVRGRIEDYLGRERPILQRIDTVRWLFLTRSGRQLSRVMAWNLVKRYAARVGCGSDVSPHTLRHSFATHMLAGGADIRALQELLGHASVRTTQVYTHVESSRLKAVHREYHPRG